MIFMAMGYHQSNQILAALLNKFWIRQQNIDTRHGIVAKGNPKIHHEPFAAIVVEVEIHSDLVTAAKREKEKILGLYLRYGTHRVLFRS